MINVPSFGVNMNKLILSGQNKQLNKFIMSMLWIKHYLHILTRQQNSYSRLCYWICKTHLSEFFIWFIQYYDIWYCYDCIAASDSSIIILFSEVVGSRYRPVSQTGYVGCIRSVRVGSKNFNMSRARKIGNVNKWCPTT